MEKQLNLFFGFLENEKKVSANTLQSYKRDLKQFEKYLNENVLTTEDAIQGAKYIIAEWISDNASYRKWITWFPQ